MLRNLINLKSRRFTVGVILALIVFIASYILLHSPVQGIVFAAAFVIVGAVQINPEILKGKRELILNAICIIAASFAISFLTQLVLNETFLSIGLLKVFLEMAISLLFILFFLILTLRVRFSVSAAAVFLVVFTTVNYYVFFFRGSELAPADILAAKTAASVASGYEIPFVRTIYYAWILCALMIFAVYALPAYKIQKKIISRAAMLGLQVCLVGALLIFSADISSNHWLQTGSVRNGYLLNFFLQFNETLVRKPRGYSRETLEKTKEKYADEEIPEGDHPDIIVIMDESFTNLGKLGNELRTNIEITPFIDSLKENTIKGYTLSSVFGGGTPNSEFEFLTGNSYMYLPYGSIAYQQYLTPDCYSIVKKLKNAGYRTIGMHPYVPFSWMRNTVYPYLGFDEGYFIDDFPQEDLVREFVSDQEMFDFMINLYEDGKKAGDENIFMFGVTMQNHGGYLYEGEDYENTVELIDYEKDYPDVEQYLTLINKTDQATEHLIDYFSNVDDEVVIVFFGDHYPRLDEDFYQEVHGDVFASLDETILKYEVPFFIWTNYDIEEKEVELTSLNFLSNYMLSAAGLGYPAYNQYLADVNKVIPAMDSNGYYSVSKDKFITFEEAEGEEADVLNLYSQMQYNNLFDEYNKNEQMFSVE